MRKTIVATAASVLAVSSVDIALVQSYSFVPNKFGRKVLRGIGLGSSPIGTPRPQQHPTSTSNRPLQIGATTSTAARTGTTKFASGLFASPEDDSQEDKTTTAVGVPPSPFFATPVEDGDLPKAEKQKAAALAEEARLEAEVKEIAAKKEHARRVAEEEARRVAVETKKKKERTAMAKKFTNDINEDLVTPIFGREFEREVPSDVIKGAALAGASLSYLAGNNWVVSGSIGIFTAYLAIVPGKPGEVIRNLGHLLWDTLMSISNGWTNFIGGDTLAIPVNLFKSAMAVLKAKMDRQSVKSIYSRAVTESLTLDADVQKVVADAEAIVKEVNGKLEKGDVSIPYDAAARLAYEGALAADKGEDFQTFKAAYKVSEIDLAVSKKQAREDVVEANLQEQAAQGEAKQLAAAEEARLAAEEEARLEAVAEAEASRVAEEARLATKAAEAEATRLAEEARLETEAEEARLEAVAEASRVAEEAEAEKSRLEAVAEASRVAEEAEAEKSRLEAVAEAEASRVAEEAEAEKARLEAVAEASKVAEEAEATRLAEEARLVDEDDSDWEDASIRMAQDLEDDKIVGMENAFGATTPNGDKLQEKPVATVDEEEEVDMEELGRLAREAVIAFESDYQDRDIAKQEQRQSWRDRVVPAGAAERSVIQNSLSDDGQPEHIWNSYTVLRLREELRSRGLSIKGKKAELVVMLDEYDAAQKVGGSSGEDKNEEFDEIMMLMDDSILDATEPSDEDLAKLAATAEAIYSPTNGDPEDDADMEAIARAAREAVEKFQAEMRDDDDGVLEEESDGAEGGKDWSELSVLQLKDELRSRGMRISGNKAALVKRLTSA